jgi:tyrosyl-tRNA synthetase
MKPDKKAIDEFLTRRVDRIIDEKELRKLLTSGKKLTVKFGVDVTSPDIHLGHGVNLWMMRQLQDWGHKVVFLIGGFTTKIGDPTGRDVTRKEISDADIKKNAKKYIEQVGHILSTKKDVFEIKNNDDWFGKMPTSEFLKLLAQVTQAQLIERDMFQKRIKEGKEIRMHEMIYPIVQGYDSVMLKDQIAMCGTDQLFNEMMGRFYQERFKQKPQTIITGQILVGTDGQKKMSKSLGNYIGITDSPKDQYGRIMSVADRAIYDYFRLATNVSTSELADIKKQLASKKTNPRDMKMQLAHIIVSMYHGTKAADKAQADFVSVFQRHDTPNDIASASLSKPMPILELLVKHKLANSNSEARRLVGQGGVKLNDKVITDIGFSVMPPKRVGKTDLILQVGKRRFLKLK